MMEWLFKYGWIIWLVSAIFSLAVMGFLLWLAYKVVMWLVTQGVV